MMLIHLSRVKYMKRKQENKDYYLHMHCTGLHPYKEQKNKRNQLVISVDKAETIIKLRS